VVTVTSSTLQSRGTRRRHGVCDTGGYTLIELVTVITLIAILAAVAGPRFFDTAVFRARGYADELAGAIRYSQKIAIATGCSVLFSATTSGYQATQQTASGNHCDSTATSWPTIVVNSDGQQVLGTVPSGVTTAAFSLTFGADGLLSSGGGVSIAVGSRQLVISQVSGYAEVQ
jgi:MSHA pilin protein MshC